MFRSNKTDQADSFRCGLMAHPEVLADIDGLHQDLYHHEKNHGRQRLVPDHINVPHRFYLPLGFLSAMVNIFQCWPVQYYYDKTLKGSCMKHQTQFFETMGSLALIEDVFILCMPMPIVWRLQSPFRQKVAVTFIFSVGSLYVFIVSKEHDCVSGR